MDTGAARRKVRRGEPSFQLAGCQNQFTGKDDEDDGHQGQQADHEIGEGSGEGLHVSHDASLSIGLAGADVAEGLGVA